MYFTAKIHNNMSVKYVLTDDEEQLFFFTDSSLIDFAQEIEDGYDEDIEITTINDAFGALPMYCITVINDGSNDIVID